MIKNKAFIHIGYPKTATTWFQYELFPFITNGHFIHRENTIREAFIYPTPFEFDAQKSEQLVDNALKKDSFPIISDEGFLAGNEYLVKDCAYRLKQVFENPEIIIFIRNQLTILPSKYSQYLKANGGTFSFKRFIKNNDQLSRINQIYFNNTSLMQYDRVIAFYKQLFGEEHVHVFLFEEFTENPQEFVKMFASKFGFEFDHWKINYKKKNEGLRRGMAPIARLLNRFTHLKRFEKHYFFSIPYWFPFTVRVINRLNKLPIFGKPLTISNFLNKKEVEEFKAIYKASNQRLIDEHNLEAIKKFNYPL